MVSEDVCDPMSRYFFDIQNGRSHVDEIGEELLNDEAAWHSAKRLTRDIEDTLAPGGQWTLEVRNSGRKIIFRIAIQSEWPR